MKDLFFDYNSTTPVREEVLEGMLPFFSDHFGNPSSVHRWGQKCRSAVEQARSEVADLIGASPEEVIFTSGGSEANSTAIMGTVWNFLAEKGHLVISSIEHPSVLRCCSFLETLGFAVARVHPDRSGIIRPENVEKALQEDTFLVSVMHSNNETGALQPVHEISAMVRSRGIRFHTDAVQSAGKVPVYVSEIGAELLSLSAHKFYGPKGAGALFLKNGERLSPIVFGGGQEMGMRGGTEMVAQVVGMGKAAQLASGELSTFHDRISRIRDRFEGKILEEIEGARINAEGAARLPNTSNILFQGISSESLMIALDLKGLGVSTGSACHSGTVEPSHVLINMGLKREEALSSLRISFGRLTTMDDALLLADALHEQIRELRASGHRSSI